MFYIVRLRLWKTRGSSQASDGLENHIVQDDRDAPMMYYTINGLRSDTYYELKAQAENDIGWSDETPSFVFRTAPGKWCVYVYMYVSR